MKHTSFLTIALFLLVFTPWIASSQTTATAVTFLTGEPLREVSYSGIEGDPFFEEKWSLGEVIFDDGQTISKKFRYNAYTNEVEYIGEEGLMVVVNPDAVGLKIHYEKKKKMVTYHFQKGFENIENLDGDQHYMVFHNGRYKLLELYKKELRSSQSADYNRAEPVRKFITVKTLYLVTGEVAHKIRLTKGAILNLLGEDKERAVAYVKKNKIKWGDPLEVGKLLAYLESN